MGVALKRRRVFAGALITKLFMILSLFVLKQLPQVIDMDTIDAFRLALNC